MQALKMHDKGKKVGRHSPKHLTFKVIQWRDPRCPLGPGQVARNLVKPGAIPVHRYYQEELICFKIDSQHLPQIRQHSRFSKDLTSECCLNVLF